MTLVQETLLIKHDLHPLHRPYYGHMTPELYAAGRHMLMSPDVYPPNGYLPRASNDQHPNNNYLPSVSYSLDHLDRLDYQVTSSNAFCKERITTNLLLLIAVVYVCFIIYLI